MDTVALLRKLSQASGISGYEAEVREIVRQAFEPYADEFRVDVMGNLIATKRGKATAGGRKRSIMLAGHMDEIGLIVKDIKQGFPRVTDVGGIDHRTLLGQEVIVHAKRDLPGVIGSRPPHVLAAADYEKPVPWDMLFIDTGLPEETVTQLVQVGDLVTLRREFLELAEGYVSGKTFDDRAGVASLAVCLEMLATMNHSWDVHAVATIQEETGLKGATVAAFGINPEIGIAVDVGFGAQQGVSDNESIKMNEGPALAIGPERAPQDAGRSIGGCSQIRDSHAKRDHPRRKRHRWLGDPGSPLRGADGCALDSAALYAYFG